jgi:hypothetical protein
MGVDGKKQDKHSRSQPRLSLVRDFAGERVWVRFWLVSSLAYRQASKAEESRYPQLGRETFVFSLTFDSVSIEINSKIPNSLNYRLPLTALYKHIPQIGPSALSKKLKIQTSCKTGAGILIKYVESILVSGHECFISAVFFWDLRLSSVVRLLHILWLVLVSHG